MSIARAEAVRLSKHILHLDEQLKSNERKLDELVGASEAAVNSLVAWPHRGQVRSEAAFACRPGVNPIPATS